jgi:hypothetical protein
MNEQYKINRRKTVAGLAAMAMSPVLLPSGNSNSKLFAKRA